MFLYALAFGFLVLAIIKLAAAPVPLSPAAMVASPDGKVLYVACATANCLLRFDVAKQKVLNLPTMPESPSGLALSADDRHLYVTCAAPESKVCIVDFAQHRITGTILAGHTSVAPVVGLDGKTLYVCNRFNNDVSVIDLAAKKEVCRIAVQREPVAADITRDGKYLLVANQLPVGRADAEFVAAAVSVIDLSARKVVEDLQFPNGSGSLKDIRVSPDGKYAAVTHLVSSFSRATTKVQFGWMNANALTIIDLARMEICSTILLDEPTRGAANPWGIAWSADGKKLAIAHAGTHEISLIDFPMLLAHLPDAFVTTEAKSASPILTFVSHYEGLDPGLPFLTGARERVQLPDGDLGPRALACAGNKVYAADYFSDTLSVIDLDAPKPEAESIPLGPKPKMNAVRKGEFYFHDARLCLQGWQSCSSCHPGDARADGFNWDLLNDGIGNPKNAKSLLLAHKTPPAMSLGVRTNAEAAVRAGIKFILFTSQPEAVSADIDEYLKSLKPVPSPYLVHGKLSQSARRGKKIFQQAGCADCHVPGLFTDSRPYDVGTRRTFDGPTDKFYTPTLIEVWRTEPYLHDGSAVTIRDVLTTRNPEGKHVDVAGLSNQEMDDLCEYVLSL